MDNRTSKRTIFTRVLTLAITAILLTTAVAFAAPHAKEALTPLQLVADLVERLELTDEQRAAIRQTLSNHRGDLEAIVEREIATRSVLFETIHAEMVDESAIRTAAQAVAAVDADLAVERAEVYSEVSTILTPQQIAEIDAFTEEVRALVATRLESTVGPRAGLDRVRLNRGQKDQIQAILEAHSAELAALAETEQAARVALRATIRRPILDEEAVRAASAEVAAVDADLAVERAELSAEIATVLTPKQQERLARLRTRLQERLAARAERATRLGLRLV